LKIAVRFSNGIGNTILLTALLRTIKDTTGEPAVILPREGTESRGLELVPPEICIRGTSSIKNQYDAIIDPQEAWPSWRRLAMHEVDFYLSLLRGNVKRVRKIEIVYNDKWMSEEEKKRPRITLINGFFKDSSDLWSRKKWNYFPQLFSILKDLYPEVEICKVGLPNELEDVPCVDYTNLGLSLVDTCGVIKNSTLVISNDTGLMHAADALCTPLVVLFGATNSTKNCPIQAPHLLVKSEKPCAPCLGTSLYKFCRSQDCMDEISVERVVQAVMTFVSKHNLFDNENMKRFLYEKVTKDFSKWEPSKSSPNIASKILSLVPKLMNASVTEESNLPS
jgi:hypothetical protein